MQLKTSLTPVTGNNLRLSSTVPDKFFSLSFSNAKVNAVLMFELLSLRRTCCINLQCLPMIVFESGIVAVCSYRCWFDILSGQCIFKILQKQFRWNVSSFSSSFWWFSRVAINWFKIKTVHHTFTVFRYL